MVISNESQIAVSIIVPVYNSEKYLKGCLDSLLKQTLKNIEIIAVNDASTDQSFSILEEYRDKSMGKIRVINLDRRRGPGGARNIGIETSRGEYIGFVDSDDDVKGNMFEILFKEALKGKYDIVDCAFFNEFANQNMRTIGNNAIGKLSIQKKKDLMLHAGFIWSKIIKKNIIVENNIKFREDDIYEDIDFIRSVILNSNKIYAVDKVLYNYRNNKKSVTNSADILYQINSKIKSMIALSDNLKKSNVYDIYKDELVYLVYKTYINILYIAVEHNQYSLKSDLYKKLKDFFFSFCDITYVDNKYIKKMPKEQRIFADLNNFDNVRFLEYIKNIV